MTSATFEESDRFHVALTSRAAQASIASKRRSWLNVVGATYFAVGAQPGYLSAVGGEADALTFFVGSPWFTSAAFLQVVEAANVDYAQPEPDVSQKLRLFA